MGRRVGSFSGCLFEECHNGPLDLVPVTVGEEDEFRKCETNPEFRVTSEKEASPNQERTLTSLSVPLKRLNGARRGVCVCVCGRWGGRSRWINPKHQGDLLRRRKTILIGYQGFTKGTSS